jgi:hypothetical protein
VLPLNRNEKSGKKIKRRAVRLVREFSRASHRIALTPEPDLTNRFS